MASTGSMADSATDGITRRQFTAGAAAVGATAAAAGALGSAGRVALADGVSMTPGTYTGKAKGCHGVISVDVTVDESSILSVEFAGTEPSHNEVVEGVDLSVDPFAVYAVAMLDETPQILDRVVDRLGDRVVEWQSTEVDAVAGATLTSRGYLNAVRDALTQAGAPEDAFMAAPTPKDDTETYEGFDVIVVGGGAGGTTAAARASALGAKVLLVEKSSRIGGCGSISTGVRVMGTKIQNEAGFPNDNETYFPDAMKQSLYYADANIMKHFLDHNNQAIDWLIDVGGFDMMPTDIGVCYAQDSIIYPMAAESWSRVAGLVDTILFETEVTELIFEGGACCGIRGRRYDGTSVEARAPKVIVATGGFMNNPELQREHNGSVFAIDFALWQDKGECLQMMWDAGARKYHIGGMNSHITQPAAHIEGVDDYTAMIPHTLLAAPCFLQVNQRGARFRQENMLAESMSANGNYIVAAGGYYYAVLSQDQVDTLAAEGLAGLGMQGAVFCVNFNYYPLAVDYKMEHIDEALAAGMEAGIVFKGETAEELAEAAGFNADAFGKALARYRSCCEAGYDDQYYKDPQYLAPMGDGPYYAIKGEVCPYSTMGGVQVDDEMRVLDEAGEPIPGLYSAGVECIGGLYNGAAYSDCGGFPFGWTCFSGFCAGSAAAGQPVEA